MREGGSRLGGGLPDVGSAEYDVEGSVPKRSEEGQRRREKQEKDGGVGRWREGRARAHLVDSPNRSHSQLKLTLHPLRRPPCPLGGFRRKSVGIRARRGEEREADGRNQVPLGKLLLVR